LVPEIGAQFAHAGVQEVAVFEDLVVEVVLRLQPERAGLDAHVDVFGDEDYRTLRMSPLQVDDDCQNLVVDLGGRQSCREVAGDRFGLQEQTAAGQPAGRPEEFDALVDGASTLVTISSSVRVTWRALRAISDIPFLWLSSSSRVMIGRKTSCSSKR
jgi:hypothetical protein